MRRLTYLMLIVNACCMLNCAGQIRPIRTSGAPKEGESSIVVIRGSGTKIELAVARAFLDAVTASTVEYELQQTNSATALARAVRRQHPALIVALGGAAAQFAHTYLPDRPLIYGLVLPEQTAELAGDTVAGVTMQEAPGAEFSFYRIVLPALRRVLTFYSADHASTQVDAARAELAHLGLELVAVPVPKGTDVAALARAHQTDAEAYWLLNDPGLVTDATFSALKAFAAESKKPLLCSTFRQFAIAGATMVVSVDFSNVGSQLASMVNQALDGADLTALGVRAPIGGRLIVNMDAANSLGIDVPAAVHPFISEMISSRAP